MTRTLPHLLIVDDDQEICQLLSRYLAPHGFRVSTRSTGEEMREALRTEPVDLVIMDVMLQGEDGLALCSELRATSRIPVIFISALDSETDRVVGLEMGADDYLPKPFSPRELLARVRALLRRTSPDPLPTDTAKRQQALIFSNWELDTARRQLRSRDGASVELSTTEYELLLAFLRNPQIVLSRDQLLRVTQGRPAGPFDRSIDVQIGHLRRKLEADPKAPDLIRTVRKAGYVLTTNVSAH